MAMHLGRRGWFVLCLIAGLASRGTRAADPSPEVQARIAAVEQGLLPAVRIKDRWKPMALTDRLESHHTPGVSIAVINNYQLEWAKGYGRVDATVNARVTEKSMFQAASVSKPIAALAALRLVDQGVLDLDRDVNQTLMTWKLPENDFTRQHAVDLRGLLSHTAGLTVHGFPGYKWGEKLPSLVQILNGEAPANNQPIRVDKVPGAGFRYSGGGTLIAQMMISDATTQRFTDVVRESVLQPLAMNSSTFEQPLPEEYYPRVVSGHDADGKPIEGRWRVHPELAAAGLWTTPSDVARYVLEVQLGRAGKSTKILSKKMVDQMLTPQNGGPVGLGPFLSAGEKTRRFGHSGANDGFKCEFVGYVDRGQGAVVMTNGDNGRRLATEVLNAIAQVYDWPDYLSEEKVIADIDPTILDRYVGEYAIEPLGSVLVTKRNDRLYAKSTLAPEAELYPESATDFFTDTPGVDAKFVANEQGEIAEVVVHVQGQELRGKKK